MSTRARKKTPAGLDYQTDLLSKEVKRLRKSLTSQVGALDELVQTADATTVKQEFERLSGTFAELSSVSNRLCALISKEDATQEENALTIDGEKLERIKSRSSTRRITILRSVKDQLMRLRRQEVSET